MTDTELAPVEPREVAPRSVNEMIWLAARDPSVDVEKLRAFLSVQEDFERREAEKAFNRALADLPALRVRRNGKVNLVRKDGSDGGSYPFAKWEDVDRVIRPIISEAGFTLAFDSEPRQGDGGGLIVRGTLLHRDGHSRTAAIPLALDTGAGRNNLQAMGSTLSYGKRYVAEMLLNIVREGGDDDGRGGTGPITEEQVARLAALIADTKSNLDRFLEYMQVTSLAEIPVNRYTEAENALLAKKKGTAA